MTSPADCGHVWRTERDEGSHDTVQTHTCHRVEGHYPDPHCCMACGQEEEAINDARQRAEYEADRLIGAYGDAMQFLVQDVQRRHSRGRRHTVGLQAELDRSRRALRAALLRGLT